MKLCNKIIYLSIISSSSSSAGAVGGIADVTVYDRMENRTLLIHQHQGRYYVVGKPGNEYQIRVANRGQQEMLSVVSVDGVNAVSGETANWAQSGYVLGSRQGFDVRGWRKSMDRIAAFYFTEHQNSYAARSERPHHVGVIGVAVFRKKYPPPLRPWPHPRWESPFPSAPGDGWSRDAPADHTRSAEVPAAAQADAQSHAPSGAMEGRADSGSSEMARVPQKSSALGTGHGRSEASHVTYTHFERASAAPAEIITIHYDTYENLLAQGVMVQAPWYAWPTPVPFPGQFVPDLR